MSESLASEAEQFLKTLKEKELKKLTELSSQDSFTIGSKTFRYHSITTRQWQELESLRADWENERMKLQRRDTSYDAVVAKTKYAKIYLKCAEYYLGISEKEFYDLPWVELETVIEACNFRTLHGSAFL